MKQREKAESQETPADLEMIDESCFQRRIVIRINTREAEAERLLPLVADLEPDGLQPSPRQRHAKKALAFAAVQDRRPDLKLIVPLDFRPFEERPFLGSRRIRNAEPWKTPDVDARHLILLIASAWYAAHALAV